MHNILEMLLSKRFCVVLLNECFLLLVWAKHQFLQLFLNWLFFIVAQGKVGEMCLCVESISFVLYDALAHNSHHTTQVSVSAGLYGQFTTASSMRIIFPTTLIPVIIVLFIML